MQGATDTNIWDYAKETKVIWLSIGNKGTKIIQEVIISNAARIKDFITNDTEDLLVIEK